MNKGPAMCTYSTSAEVFVNNKKIYITPISNIVSRGMTLKDLNIPLAKITIGTDQKILSEWLEESENVDSQHKYSIYLISIAILAFVIIMAILCFKKNKFAFCRYSIRVQLKAQIIAI